jgi:hypothetical protein
MPSPGQSTLFNTFTELVSTTYRNHKKEVADNMSNHNALYNILTKKGRIRKEDGGLSIVAILEYAENGTFTRYSGYDPLNVGASDVISAAEFPWRQASVNIAASGLEIRSNQGENRIVNLVKTKINNGKKSFVNGITEDFYSAGLLSNQVNGVQALIADAGTGTVGGINSTTFTFWRNTVQSAAAPLQGGAGITPSATTIESLMLPLYLRLTRGADKPDLIVMSEDYFTFYEQSQTSLKRYAPSDDGQGGMVKMKYKTSDVVFDSSASGMPSAHGYFMNSDYFELVVHSDADMEIMPELRAVNQDAVVIPIIWQGNLVVSNRALQGVLKA